MIDQLEQRHANQKIINIMSNLDKMGVEHMDDSSDDFKSIPKDVVEERKTRKTKHQILKDFLLAKKLEGCSNNTIKLYYDILIHFLMTINKHPSNITTQDIREYLIVYQDTHRITNGSLDNMRRIFSSFFNWMEEEDYVQKNPVRKVHRIKSEKVIKKAFTDEEIELLRDHCQTIRELAIIDFLYSSGVRVSELISLNIDDLNFEEREGIVFGKGGKERIIYFDARSKIHLKKYISERIDDNPALFVTARYPFRRLQKSGVEILLREIGERAGVENVHPHRFRRTLATNMIEKGIPIEQVQKVLGHTKIDTTLLYANVNQSTVKLNHSKFI